MKLYSNGTLGFIATVTSLVANQEINGQFNTTNPYIFWIGQIVLCMIFMVVLFHILRHWDNESPFTKTRLSISIGVYGLMYAMAYTGFKYAFVLIFLVGVTEIYLTRKKANLMK
ncbi:hypothetical protein [Granulicatella seriolae]|uniref:Uncharacterized protein n=1 Tax=Granulicatella seriolae TaxID=2967226 RepID=A0ABT1WKH4_9LACT|nr:hypothetical protein [Granulicatella seriolae]